MNKRIVAYVDELFIGKQHDPQAMDVKEELLANLSDKYEDLIAEGKSEGEAYETVIDSVGDIKGLMGGLEDVGEFKADDIKKNRNLRSIFLSLGASIYVLGLAVVFAFDQLQFYSLGIGIMLILWAAATGLIVYGNNLGKYKYEKKDNTFAENYKERLSRNDRNKRMISSLSALNWSAIFTLYFAVSFSTGFWFITWIIFFAGTFLQLLIFYKYGRKRHNNALQYGMIFCVALILYFIVSFGLRAWHWSWLILLLTIAVQQILKLARLWREEE